MAYARGKAFNGSYNGTGRKRKQRSGGNNRRSVRCGRLNQWRVHPVRGGRVPCVGASRMVRVRPVARNGRRVVVGGGPSVATNQSGWGMW